MTSLHSPSGGADGLPDELLAAARRYAAQPVRQPSPALTAALVDRVMAEATSVPGADAVPPAPLGERSMQALRVARWRVRQLGAAFWLASVALLALGALGSAPLHLAGASFPAGAALVLLAPLTAALGLAHALRTPSGGLRAVEASCPVGAAEALTGLVLAIIGFDAAFAALATLGVALAGWAPFLALLAAWLGPLLALVGFTLPAALRWGARPAALAAAGAWTMLALATRWLPADALPPAGAAPLRLLCGLAGLLLLVLTLRGGRAWPPLPLADHRFHGRRRPS